MATHKSAIKRNRQNEQRRLRNKSVKSFLRSRIKQVTSAVAAKDAEKARESLDKAVPVIDKAASKGVIHRRNAARKISRLTRSVNAVTTS
jgi:small subunit ribosomal protein S20